MCQVEEHLRFVHLAPHTLQNAHAWASRKPQHFVAVPFLKDTTLVLLAYTSNLYLGYTPAAACTSQSEPKVLCLPMAYGYV